MPDTRTTARADASYYGLPLAADEERRVLRDRVSWGAVLAGVVVALVVQLILNMIGIGVGASTFDVSGAEGSATASGLSIGAAIWWTVSGVLAAFAGGFAAGRLAGHPRRITAGWHGLTSWAVTTLVVFWLLTSTIGVVVGGAYSTLRSSAGSIPLPGIDEATQRATEAAAVASGAVARGALIAALALLLGAIAAWAGGRLGAMDPATVEQDR